VQRADAAAQPQKKAKRSRGLATAESQTPRSAPLDLSNHSFLDILRRGSIDGARNADSKKNAPGAHYLRDDFLLADSKAKHWGRPLDDVEDGEEEGGEDGEDGGADADIDDDDDLGDML